MCFFPVLMMIDDHELNVNQIQITQSKSHQNKRLPKQTAIDFDLKIKTHVGNTNQTHVANTIETTVA